ncbi:hypothetical protein FS749_007324 [Ceratobasidium sp. UAMH 11750]|nr:hypothetical protein FS749_007324 [Ceratobasidium sp. UAMH 11750]
MSTNSSLANLGGSAEPQNVAPSASDIFASTTPDSVSSGGSSVSGQLRKRKATSTLAPSTESHGARRKDAHAQLANLLQALDAAAHPPPTLAAPVSAPVASHLQPTATDLWYHITLAWTPSPPADFDSDQQIIWDIEYQDSKPFRSFRRPTNCEFIRCIPCLAAGSWHIWLNRQGTTRAIRDHMIKYHPDNYSAKCKEQGLDLTAIDPDSNIDGPPPPFTREGLVERIIRWIAVDDQSLNAIEQPEFREILVYCGQGVLRDHDIPHRSKIAFEMHQVYLQEKELIVKAMQKSLGRISLTTDLWSDQLIRSFMAVTVHYIDCLGDPAEHLVAFRKIDGQHTGANVGHVLFSVLDEISMIGKIGHITMDNASNNNTLMDELEREFAARSLPFDAEENRVCCFPHVINLAVQRFLAQVPASAQQCRGVLAELGIEPTASQEAYLDAVESNPVRAVHNTVTAIRASGQRRDDFMRLTKEGNLAGHWRAPNGEVVVVPELELKVDVCTRWGSTADMVDRFIELYLPATELSLRNHEAAIPIVTHKQYEVLQDISTVLSVARRTQDLLSAERTPTLSLALPVYETILELWRDCRHIFPELALAIDGAILKVEEYVLKSRRSPVHVLAMFVNPSLKLEWINKHWHASTAQQAHKIVENKLLEYARERHETLFGPSTMPSSNAASVASSAAQAQAHGYRNLLDLSGKIQRADGTTQHIASSSADSTIPGCLALNLSPAQRAVHDLAAVQMEMAGYITLGTVSASDTHSGVDIISQWKSLRHTFPLIHRLAVDILPVQASSVSSERVFSSSKLTCTRERSRMAVGTVESLQVHR